MMLPPKEAAYYTAMRSAVKPYSCYIFIFDCHYELIIVALPALQPSLTALPAQSTYTFTIHLNNNEYPHYYILDFVHLGSSCQSI